MAVTEFVAFPFQPHRERSKVIHLERQMHEIGLPCTAGAPDANWQISISSSLLGVAKNTNSAPCGDV